jgi:1-acylglycerone phosphate reductase
MTHLASLSIDTLTLDVLSNSSIAAYVSKLSSLDILVNNAGAEFLMPVSGVSIPEAKKLFDLNVWSYPTMTQAFLPLLLKSKGMSVNQTSIGSVAVLPFQSVYAACKAAIAMFSDSMRLELAAFGIKVIDSKTGVVRSNLTKNQNEANHPSLPENSIYQPAKEVVERALRQEGFAETGIPTDKWAKGVVQDLLRENPPKLVWRGNSAGLARIGSVLPFGMFYGTIRR